MAGAQVRLWDFVDALDGAASVEDVGSIFLAATAGMGFEHVAILSEVDPLNPGPHGVFIRRIPETWVQRYSEQRYFVDDAVHQESRRRVTPFQLDGPGFREGLSEHQVQMLDELIEAKLGDALCVPIRTPGELDATCALFSGENDIDPSSYQLAHSMAVFTHAGACRRRPATRAPAATLTARERECLLLAARGKSDWEIGELLNLSERTVHHAIERAKRRLGVGTRVQAIVRAIHEGEFSTDEVLA